MKRLNILFISVIMLFSLLYPGFSPISHASSLKIRILELVDSGSGELTTYLREKNILSNYEITTMRMKEFVAERKDIDGLYDAIYIGKGDYNPSLPVLDPQYGKNKITNNEGTYNRVSANNTKNVMNDITVLKANQILNNYVYKGLPVILHSNIKNQKIEDEKATGKSSVLKDTFFKNGIDKSPNVFVIDNIKSFPQDKINIIRPRLNLVSPSTKNDIEYEQNDEIVYTFKLDSGNKSDLTANFYIDADYNNQFSQEEALRSTSLNNLEVEDNTFQFKYRLPKGFSGPRFWKLELVDSQNRKDFVTGEYQFKGERVDINVLQIVPDDNSGNLVNVLNRIPGKNGNVISNDKYKITIDTIKFNDFQKPCRSNETCYQTINNGKYNMIVFGFRDSYNNLNLEKAVGDEIRKFADTGQSLFLTHDTFIRRNNNNNQLELTNNWFNSLFELSGQTYELKTAANTSITKKLSEPGKYYLEHNLGYFAKAGSSNTIKVNDGLMTTYPFTLKNNVPVALTHSQYFSLNLEDPDVIPWYNLDSSSKDSADSWNHYYIYSYKNITYSGAGHTNNNFAEEEQKLFVNTLYRAFLSANHQPIISVVNPVKDEKIPSYHKNVDITFKVEDLDLTDKFLNTKLYVNGNLKDEKTGVSNGTLINYSYEHKLTNGGKLDIKIEVTDKKGALAVETMTVEIEKVDAQVELSRSLSTDTIVKVNSPVTINYTVTPKEMDLKDESVDTSLVKPIALYEDKINTVKEESYVDIFDHPNLVDADLLYIDSPRANDLPEKFNYGIKYVLGDDYNRITVEQLNEIAKLTPGNKTGKVNEGLDMLLNQGEFIFPVVDSSGKFTKFALFSSLRVDKSKKKYEAKFLGFTGNPIQLEYNYSLKEEFPVNMDIDLNKIDGLIDVSKKVIDNKVIISGKLPPIKYTQNTANPIQVSITVVPKEKGKYNLTNSVISEQKTGKTLEFNKLYFEAKYGINKVTIPDEMRLYLGDDKKVNITYDPENALEEGLVQSINWTSTDNSIVTVNSEGILTPKTPGRTEVSLKVKDIFGTEFLQKIDIVVIKPVNTITMVKDLTLKVGETKDLQLKVDPEDAKSVLEWKIDNNSLVEVDKHSGTVKGLKPGKTTIIASGYNKDGELVHASTVVEVIQPVKKIVINPNPIEVEVTDTITFSNKVEPSNATNKTLDMHMENSSVAVLIDDEHVVGLKEGTTYLIVKTTDGSGVEIKVPVHVTNPSLKEIKFKKAVFKIRANEKVLVKDLLVFNPEKAKKELKAVTSTLTNKVSIIFDDGEYYIEAKEIGYSTVKVEAPMQKDGTTPKPASALFEVVDQNEDTNVGPPGGGRW